MTLSHPPPHYFRGGARGKLHCPFITQGGEGRGKTNKKRKATKSKGRGLNDLEEGASRALMCQVGEEGCGGRVSHNRYNVSLVPQAALEDPKG